MTPNTVASEDQSYSRLRYVIVGFLVSLVIGLVYAWSVFVLPLEKEFGWNRAQTQLTFTISIITLSLGMIIGGRLSDRYGPKVLALIGSGLLTLGFLIASYTTSLGMLYFGYGILVGFGVGTTNICLTSTVARWFPDRRGLMIGILTMGFGLSGFLFGGLVGQFISKIGWQWSFRIISVASLVLCVGGSLALAFPPAGWAPTTSGGAGAQAARAVRNYEWKEMIKTSPWWTWWLWDFVLCIAGLMVMAHVVPMAVEKGVTKAQAGWAMGLFALFNGFGRVFFGWLWDKIGRKKSMLLDAVLMTGALLGIRFLTQFFGFPGFFLSVICTGLAYGGLPALNSTFLVGSFGPKNAGVIIGLGTTPMMVAVFIGPYLGSFVQMSSGYDLTLLLGAVTAGVAIITVFFIGDAQERNQA